MKKTICFLLTILLLLCVGCAQSVNEQSTEIPTDAPTEPTTLQTVTVAPELLPSVFEDAADFVSAGNIAITAVPGATEVTQIVLFNEISQVQFMYNDVLFTYRAAFASTGRNGYELTGILGEAEYLETPVSYTTSGIEVEAHLLENGGILLWTDNEINYSLVSFGGTFEDLSAVADLIFEN